MFINYLFEEPFFYVAWVLIVAFSICVHEYAHAYIALRLGDDTAAEEGHLSLNPFVQMGGMSLIMLVVIGIAWGAVPVSISRFRQRWAGAVVAVAGPLSNLVLSAIFSLLFVGVMTFGGEGVGRELPMFFRVGAMANGVLFFLNMLPVPMFDGWSVFSYFIPGLGRVSPQSAQHISLVLILLIFLTPFGGFIWAVGGGIAEFLMALWGLLFAGAMIHPAIL